jgi:hypothetical protein
MGTEMSTLRAAMAHDENKPIGAACKNCGCRANENRMDAPGR